MGRSGQTVESVRSDFDRIALLPGAGWDHNAHYHEYLLRQVPERCRRALEIGCGTGEFSRLLAARAESVLAVDLSPQMIRLAKSQSAGRENVEYLLGDVMQLPLPAAGYDCIVSVVTLHHLPLAEALLKMKDALRPGGVLIIHDLVADAGVVDRCLSALAYAVSVMRRLRETGRVRASREVREAWAEHGKNEVYLTMAEVRETCRKYLPSARVKRHLLWRYTVVWRKPAAA